MPTTIRVARLARVTMAFALLPALAPEVSAQALPPASQLIAHWAKETNADGWKAHKSARMKAAFDLPAMGMSATMETVTIYPSQTVVKIDLPGMGVMSNGFNGEFAWSNNPMTGPSIMTGEQLESAREDNHPSNYSRISPAIDSSKTLEKTTLNNTECYRVEHWWKSGKSSFDCFSVADGMIVWSQTTVSTPQGNVDAVTSFSAYKDWGGVKRATTTTMEQMGQQFIITLQGWEWDTVDPKELALPAEIKALTDKK